MVRSAVRGFRFDFVPRILYFTDFTGYLLDIQHKRIVVENSRQVRLMARYLKRDSFTLYWSLT